MAAVALRDRLFREAEIEAERFLSLVRIVAAVVLAVALGAALWAVGGPPPEVVGQIPTALPILAAYVVIGIVSWRLSTAARFRAWMPWAFTTADCLLVLANVGMTMRNLGIDPTTLWVYPATWLAPLVLVFGALRYDPWLQGFAAILLIGGLGLLLWLMPDPVAGLGPIEPLLQLPPTIVRVVLFTLAALVLVLAAVRRRTLLVRAIDETERRGNLARYLPPEIAGIVEAGDVARLKRGWQVEAGILIVDIRGFTRRVEGLPPSAVTALLDRFRALVLAAARAHGGVVDKFVGDNAILVFGVPEAGADDAGRTVACARALLEGVERWNGEGTDEPLRIGIGAHYGPVFAGVVGDDARLEFTVLGDTVNVAARLEQLTKEVGAELLASRTLVERAGEERGWRALPDVALRGRSELVAARLWEGPAGN